MLVKLPLQCSVLYDRGSVFLVLSSLLSLPLVWLLHDLKPLKHMSDREAPVFSFNWNNVLCFSGTQISCFSPSSFSWRQAAFVDSYCWAAVQQKGSLQSDSGNLPLWLHKVLRGAFFSLSCLLVNENAVPIQSHG